MEDVTCIHEPSSSLNNNQTFCTPSSVNFTLGTKDINKNSLSQYQSKCATINFVWYSSNNYSKFEKPITKFLQFTN